MIAFFKFAVSNWKLKVSNHMASDCELQVIASSCLTSDMTNA